MRKLFFVLLLIPIAANADLIDVGDTTVDTSTGLEWLDLTLTAGQSYDQIIAGFGGYIADGWTYATTEQLCALLAELGDVTGCGQSGLQDGAYPNAATFVSLFGATFTGSARGIYDSGLLGIGQVGIGCVNESASACTNTATPPSWLTLDAFAGTAGSGATIGSFLVRKVSVPEPGTVALLCLGLAGMGLARRRRRT